MKDITVALSDARYNAHRIIAEDFQEIMYTFLKIVTLEGWDALQVEWNDLVTRGVISAPFLRHEMLRTWWQSLGGGEWADGELAIYIAREGTTLLGVAPFFITKMADGRRLLQFIGSFEIMDYLDLIVSPQNHSTFLVELLDHLAVEQNTSWDEVRLYNLLDTSPTITSLESIATERGWNYSVEHLQPAPRIELPGDFELYLAGIDKKQRHEIRRKMRRLEHSGHMHRWFIVEHAAALEDEISAFIHLMSLDDKKKAFLTPAMDAQMRSLIRSAFQNGSLHLSFLEIDGTRSAAYLSFLYEDQLFVYNSGVNPEQYDFSPGWVLLGHLLEWANEKRLKFFDFMRGSEDYKYKFGAISRNVHLVKLIPPARQG